MSDLMLCEFEAKKLIETEKACNNLRTENEALKVKLGVAVDALTFCSDQYVSFYSGPMNGGHETEPIKTERRDTLQARKARQALQTIQGDK